MPIKKKSKRTRERLWQVEWWLVNGWAGSVVVAATSHDDAIWAAHRKAPKSKLKGILRYDVKPLEWYKGVSCA